jgi:F0F1-type ATP synthase delta subunit
MKKKLKQLVTKSYRDNQLDAETVGLIADHLNRQMLKQYITLLKQEERKNQVIITSSTALTEKERTTIQQQFPKKNIIYFIDPETINGIQILDNDKAYTLTLQQRFHDIIGYLNNYD